MHAFVALLTFEMGDVIFIQLCNVPFRFVSVLRFHVPFRSCCISETDRLDWREREIDDASIPASNIHICLLKASHRGLSLWTWLWLLVTASYV